MMSTAPVFNSILHAKTEGCLKTKNNKNQAFEIHFHADGIIPFPQVIIRHLGTEWIYRGELQSNTKKTYHYKVSVESERLTSGDYQAQIEGCKKANFQFANDNDWIKIFHNFSITKAQEEKAIQNTSGDLRFKRKASRKSEKSISKQVKIFFGIHKHMHQPYYEATQPEYWDGEKDEIFGTRTGPYTTFIPAAIHHYEKGELDHGGLSTSWSGTLIDQLNRCEKKGLCGGNFSDWSSPQKETLNHRTLKGNQRLCYSAFGYFHPLMPLIPARDIVKNIEMHREIIESTFGVPASKILFPPETAFHVRMIPALKKAGIEAVIYDSVHRSRATKNYPYAGIEEGMLPPNQSDQVNPESSDWLQLQNVWAPSKICPSFLKPEYVSYTDPDGEEHKMIAIPAERYMGNEDARGGFGALQYPNVFGQLYDNILETNNYDPEHPPFFLLHSDGDNYGGGTDSYYQNNTQELVQWLKQDSRFELMSAEDYLDLYPPNPSETVHIEPGSWAGADNGDPQFKKWFGMYDQPYSPDLNSWAVLTALQNLSHSLEDSKINKSLSNEIAFLMLTAETSCYWYWTGQDKWDFQVSHAANKAWDLASDYIHMLKDRDTNGPTIFSPWVTPENPGGQTWGNHCLKDAEKKGVVHSYIYDINGVTDVILTLRNKKTEEKFLMKNNGTYPCHSGAHVTSEYYTFEFSQSLGDCEYYITAMDNKGNESRSSLERIYLK